MPNAVYEGDSTAVRTAKTLASAKEIYPSPSIDSFQSGPGNSRNTSHLIYLALMHEQEIT